MEKVEGLGVSVLIDMLAAGLDRHAIGVCVPKTSAPLTEGWRIRRYWFRMGGPPSYGPTILSTMIQDAEWRAEYLRVNPWTYFYDHQPRRHKEPQHILHCNAGYFMTNFLWEKRE